MAPAASIFNETFKLAVAAAIENRNKINAGRKHGDKMVREELINIPTSTPLKTEKHRFVETKVKEEMNNIKQQYKTSNKMGDNGFKGINQIQKHEKKVFIRSRL